MAGRLRVPDYAARDGDLAIVTTLFQAKAGSQTAANYVRFLNAAQQSGAPVYVIECSLNAQFLTSTGRTVLHAQARHPGWHKERLLNIAIGEIPEQYTKIAWLDADVLFDDPHWVWRASELLEKFPLIQLFQTARFLNQDGSMQRELDSMAYAVASRGRGRVFPTAATPAHPGFAWAARRELLTKCPLYDRAGTMEADSLMAAACWDAREQAVARRQLQFECAQKWWETWWPLVLERVGHLPGRIDHLWHGTSVSRQYWTLWKRLRAAGFNPDTDLIEGSFGTLEYPAEKAQRFADVFADYFAWRNYDH